MGILSEDYIMKRLKEFSNSDAGKKKIIKYQKDIYTGNTKGFSGALTKDKVKAITQDVKKEFITAVKNVIASFRGNFVHINIGEINAKGQVAANITVDEVGLRRESLHYINKNNSIGHGEGIDDILSLFTHGYSITGRRPYGFWVKDGASSKTGSPLTHIGARMHRDPNPFLSELADKMTDKYAGVCKITLNDKYTEGGG